MNNFIKDHLTYILLREFDHIVRFISEISYIMNFHTWTDHQLKGEKAILGTFLLLSKIKIIIVGIFFSHMKIKTSQDTFITLENQIISY